MSTEIIKHQCCGAGGAMLPIKAMADLHAIGECIAQSGMFGVKNAASGLIVAATCYQQGLTLMEFQRTYHIIDGRPSMKADAMLAEFRRAGGRYKITENSATRAAAEFSFEGNTYPAEFTIEDAMQTGDCYEGKSDKVKYTWQKRPADMLWARLVSRAVRRLAPEIVAGIYTPEEVSDMREPPRDGPPVPLAPDVIEAIADESEDRSASSGAGHQYEFCPDGFGEFSNQPWASMPDEVLAAALGSDKLNHSYKAAVRLVIEQREKGEI